MILLFDGYLTENEYSRTSSPCKALFMRYLSIVAFFDCCLTEATKLLLLLKFNSLNSRYLSFDFLFDRCLTGISLIQRRPSLISAKTRSCFSYLPWLKNHSVCSVVINGGIV